MAAESSRDRSLRPGLRIRGWNHRNECAYYPVHPDCDTGKEKKIARRIALGLLQEEIPMQECPERKTLDIVILYYIQVIGDTT